MKATINWTSRTVWTGIASIVLGMSKIFFPEYIAFELDPAPMISFGAGLIFLKS